MPRLPNFIREYIDTPVERLLPQHFDSDHWALAHQVLDARIGHRQTAGS